MKVIPSLQEQITQAEFAQMIGVSEAAVSQMVKAGVIQPGGTAHGWLLAYTNRMREQAAGRMGAAEGVDLAYERALLAREQREGQRLKNEQARGTYAPIELLSDVLANASQAVVDRLDQIPGALKRKCPDLPQAARDAVMAEIASARNEWVRKTLELVEAALEEAEQPVEDEDGEAGLPELEDELQPSAG